MERSPSDIPELSETIKVSDGIHTDIGELTEEQFPEYQLTKNRVWQALANDESLKRVHINIARASRKITKMVLIKGMSLENAMDIYKSRIKSIQN